MDEVRKELWYVRIQIWFWLYDFGFRFRSFGGQNLSKIYEPYLKKNNNNNNDNNFLMKKKKKVFTFCRSLPLCLPSCSIAVLRWSFDGWKAVSYFSCQFRGWWVVTCFFLFHFFFLFVFFVGIPHVFLLSRLRCCVGRIEFEPTWPFQSKSEI